MRSKIIADITSNHMGDMRVIEAMVLCLADHGVDILKTQSWLANNLRKDIPDYQMNFDYYTKHQLSDKDHFKIKEMCDKHDIEMLATCFDLNRIDLLASLGLKIVKVASPDTANYKMIEKCLEKFDHLMISTGATTEAELEKTMDICKGSDVVFLHCVTKYPCPLDEVNMDRMLYIKDKGFRVGYSDHTTGTEAAKYAICLGAEYVEKHFSLNRYLPGRDQKMSATIDEFSEIVDWARLVEEMKGTPIPDLSQDELTYRRNYIGKWGNNT